MTTIMATNGQVIEIVDQYGREVTNLTTNCQVILDENGKGMVVVGNRLERRTYLAKKRKKLK